MKAVSIALVVGLAGCTFVQPVSAAGSPKFTEKVVYSFAGGADGYVPVAGLIDVDGMLYGTTLLGGTGCAGGLGCGTVFSLDPGSGAELVVYSFCTQPNCSDGSLPYVGLIDVEGTLYGTTHQGGSVGCRGVGCGTVFSLDPNTGAESVLHSVRRAPGSEPNGLTDIGVDLYGTTEDGGARNCECGTVLSINRRTGALIVLHSFGGGADGAHPVAGLINVNGILYGTTSQGGGPDCAGSGCGTVFSIDVSRGTEKVLYSFAGGADGASPQAGMIYLDGVLYGTTQAGGGEGCTASEPPGCGTVFAFDPNTGTESVLHSFGKSTDGQIPDAGLIAMNGMLYGTTVYGGVNRGGTAFSLDPGTDAERVVYAFCSQQNCTDGTSPFANLIDVKGVLYGITAYGGTSGHGAVFALKRKDPTTH